MFERNWKRTFRDFEKVVIGKVDENGK